MAKVLRSTLELETPETGEMAAIATPLRDYRFAWLLNRHLRMGLRRVADVLFGADTFKQDWHADGALRARVRRLVRRGQRLMRGGYRRLAQLPALAQGRSAVRAKRP